jgi:phenylalanyl-tRNA synthetase alpha chain
VTLKEQIVHLQSEYTNALQHAKTESALEQVRIHYMGRQGTVATLMECLKALSSEEKRLYGPLLNDLKKNFQEQYERRYAELIAEHAQRNAHKLRNFDVTAYRTPELEGSLHVYTQVSQELENIFISMGYEVINGPEVEEEFYNFTALNIPEHHPARDMQDTFWLNIPGMLMRTHTSNVQVRAMKERKPPFALYSSGRVFRNEATDATHDFMFRQGELLFVDKDVSMANLLATAQTFLRAIFAHESIKIRVRPSYFPFVEPGVEIDASCPFCSGGCSVCKKSGWIELLGAGLVHPTVLRHGGIDPTEYSAFALGFGLVRIAMLRHGINDVRLFHSMNVDFLKQF